MVTALFTTLGAAHASGLLFGPSETEITPPSSPGPGAPTEHAPRRGSGDPSDETEPDEVRSPTGSESASTGDDTGGREDEVGPAVEDGTDDDEGASGTGDHDTTTDDDEVSGTGDNDGTGDHEATSGGDGAADNADTTNPEEPGDTDGTADNDGTADLEEPSTSDSSDSSDDPSDAAAEDVLPSENQ